VADAEDFRALARSSPWLFSTLRFTYRDGRSEGTVRGRLRRPDALRVETLGGALLEVVRTSPSPPLAPPVLRSDGLVAEPRRYLDRDGDPMWQSYVWVAALDPVELADGQERDGAGGPSAAPPLDVGPVREVEHGGRPAWEATVTTTATYEPRCGCCSLLRDAEIDRLEWEDAAQRFAGAVYPTAHRVRLDTGTGVCVLAEALDGSWAGAGHDLRIEAVGEPMADDLFVQPRRRPRWGYSPFPRPGRS
jgi:hypothetical protein